MTFGGFDERRRSPSPRSAAAPLADINMTPLIDVMLVLLVVFIIAAPLFARSIALDLPKQDGATRNMTTARIAVSIDRHGQYFWDGKPVGVDELNQKFDEVAKHGHQPEVALSADEATPYRRIAAVMAAAQRVGLQHFGFVVAGPVK